MNKIVREKLKQVFILLIIIIGFLGAIFIMLKYKTEGETNLPYLPSKILIISSAEAVSKTENPDNNKWNLDINQYNDIYIEIGKNGEYKKQSNIKSVKIENIYVSQPKVGTIKKYMPATVEDKLFTYDNNLEIVDSLTYEGAEENDTKNLKIGNQGGTALFRIVNENVSEFVSNEDAELTYNGSLLKLTNVNEEDLNVDVSFDLVIETNKLTYRGKVSFTLPRENLEEDGVAKKTIEYPNIVFKRE